MSDRDTIDEGSSSEAAARLNEPLLPPTATESMIVTTATRNAHEETPQGWFMDGLPWKTSVLIKSLYFLDALGSSTWGRFSAIYYGQHGLDARHVGIIEGVRSILPTFSMVFWGYIADQYQARKTVWVVTKSTSTVILLTLSSPWIFRSFWHILAVSIGAQLFVSNGILDAYTLDVLGRTNKMLYGRYRLYASLSWGLGSMVIGWITDAYGGFEPNFILFGVLGALMVSLVAYELPEFIPNEEEVEEDEQPTLLDNASIENVDVASHGSPSNEATSEENSKSIMELVRLALRPRVLVFLLEVVVMGSGMATVERLLFLYLVNDLGASTTLCGLSVGVNVLFELPVFWYASHFVQLLHHDGMMILAMACFVIRVYSYTLLTPSTKEWILVLESMHGITFACFWVVTTDISKVLIHETRGSSKWRTTIPSSVHMLYSALGVSCGSVIGGWAMNRYGSKTMYRGTASIVAATLLVQIAGTILVRLCGKDGANPTSFLPAHATRRHNPQSESNIEEGSTSGNASTIQQSDEAYPQDEEKSESL